MRPPGSSGSSGGPSPPRRPRPLHGPCAHPDRQAPPEPDLAVAVDRLGDTSIRECGQEQRDQDRGQQPVLTGRRSPECRESRDDCTKRRDQRGQADDSELARDLEKQIVRVLHAVADRCGLRREPARAQAQPKVLRERRDRARPQARATVAR